MELDPQVVQSAMAANAYLNIVFFVLAAGALAFAFHRTGHGIGWAVLALVPAVLQVSSVFSYVLIDRFGNGILIYTWFVQSVPFCMFALLLAIFAIRPWPVSRAS